MKDNLRPSQMSGTTGREDRAIEMGAINHYGFDSQINVAIEEMSELTKELCKHNRKLGNLEHICEEIADVQIMIEQMAMIFGEPKVESYKQYKLQRLMKRMEEEYLVRFNIEDSPVWGEL